MKVKFLFLLNVSFGNLLKPRNFDSIRHDNFDRLWKLDFENSAWLVHTDTTSISASLLDNGKPEITGNSNVLLIEDCNQATSFDYIFDKKLFIWGDHGISTHNIPGKGFKTGKNACVILNPLT